MNLSVTDELHESRKLLLREKSLNLHLLVTGITAGDVVKRATANQVFDDIVPDHLVITRDDTYSLAAVERGSEIINHNAINPRAYQPYDHHSEIIDKDIRNRLKIKNSDTFLIFGQKISLT
mgnify:CR=1 FL=1